MYIRLARYAYTLANILYPVQSLGLKSRLPLFLSQYSSGDSEGSFAGPESRIRYKISVIKYWYAPARDPSVMVRNG